MKKFLILTLALFVASCTSCNKEDEDFTPYPDGKNRKEQPRS
jgi:hypothetical protein